MAAAKFFDKKFTPHGSEAVVCTRENTHPPPPNAAPQAGRPRGGPAAEKLGGEAACDRAAGLPRAGQGRASAPRELGSPGQGRAGQGRAGRVRPGQPGSRAAWHAIRRRTKAR